MARYIRFQTTITCPETGWPLGLFRASGFLCETEQYQVVLRGWMEEVYGWFNSNLRVPASADLDRRAVFWFLPDAKECIGEAWGLAAAYREAGIPVTLERTNCPGRIVYRDEHQIGAIPYWHYGRGPPVSGAPGFVLGVWRIARDSAKVEGQVQLLARTLVRREARDPRCEEGEVCSDPYSLKPVA